jgi:5'-nucleotidase
MKKVVYIDMDNVLVDFPSAFPKLSEEIKAEYKDREDENPDIFSMMTPISGAIEAINKIASHFDTYILSTSPWENPTAWSDKLIWAKKYLGKHAYKRLILSHHKNLNRGDYLIDDRFKNGVDKFQGEHIHFGSDKFPDWESVLAYLFIENREQI